MKTINAAVRSSIDLEAYASIKSGTRQQLKKLSRKQVRARENEQLRSELAQWDTQPAEMHAAAPQKLIHSIAAQGEKAMGHHVHHQRQWRRGGHRVASTVHYARKLIDSIVTVRYVGRNALPEVQYHVRASCAMA